MNPVMITGRNIRVAQKEARRFGVQWGKPNDSGGVYYYLYTEDPEKKAQIRQIWEEETE